MSSGFENAYEFDVPDDITNGNFLERPGYYHAKVDSIEQDPEKKDGSLIENAAFRVNCSVLEGTVAGQQNRMFDLLFFKPKLNSEDGGKFANKKIARFLDAINMLPKDARGKRTKIQLDDASGNQFIVELEKDKDGRFLQMRFANVWHVDDPDVADKPKNDGCLKLIPADRRRSAAYYAAERGGSPPAEAGAGKRQQQRQTASAGVNVDDL